MTLDGSYNNTISNNTITGNTGDGVNVTAASYGNNFSDNKITDNTMDGVAITGASVNNTFTSNTISCNGLVCTDKPGTGYGVNVSGSGTIGNAILSNSIYRNSNPGITLSDGGNGYQKAPVSVTAQLQGTSIVVSGKVEAVGGYSGLFQVQVFGNINDDRQGTQLLGSSDLPAGAFTITVPEGTLPSGATPKYVTVTATPVEGAQNTSEFSTGTVIT